MCSLNVQFRMKIKRCIRRLFLILAALLVINLIITVTRLENYLHQIKRFTHQFDEDIDIVSLENIRDYYDSIFNSIVKTKQYCSETPNNLVGKIKVNQPAPNFNPFSEKLLFKFPNYTSINGRWRPVNCIPRHRVAVIIPFKDRLNNLKYFLTNMHPFLQKQQLEYQIFVVEQSNEQLFNKGVLMNSGFIEIMTKDRNELFDMKDYHFDCVIFHDVDLLPEGLFSF